MEMIIYSHRRLSISAISDSFLAHRSLRFLSSAPSVSGASVNELIAAEYLHTTIGKAMYSVTVSRRCAQRWHPQAHRSRKGEYCYKHF